MKKILILGAFVLGTVGCLSSKPDPAKELSKAKANEAAAEASIAAKLAPVTAESINIHNAVQKADALERELKVAQKATAKADLSK